MTSWERSVSATTLGSDGGTITVSSIPVKRLLHVEAYLKSTGSIESVIQFNADTGSNYWKRLNNNGSASSSSSAGTGIDTNLSSTAEQFISFDVINIAGKEKLITGTITDSGGAGEANLPNCVQFTGVWTNTSDAITNVRIFNNESGDFSAGSILTVWGGGDATVTDKSKDSITNVPVGTRYEETDTRKIFRYAQVLVSGTDLKAYYKFDETSGTTFTNDASLVTGNDTISNGNLTLSGVTLDQSGSPSNLGVNAKWDGSNDYAQAQSGTNSNFNFLHTANDWTISFWAIIENRSPFANQIIIDNKAASGTSNQYGIDLRTNNTQLMRIVINTGSTGSDVTSPANYIPDNTNWHYYTITWDNSATTFTWWRDGASIGTSSGATGAGSTAIGEMTFGGYYNDETGGSLKGSLCEMSFWERILTSAEISKLYQDGAGLQLDTGAKVWKEKGSA